jgi:hypothetical protein
MLEGITHVELLTNAMMRLGRTLGTAHELGIFHCFTHPGNVDAHGNLIDFEHAIYRDEIPAIKECIPDKSDDTELFCEEGLRFRDIDIFFAGARDVLMRYQKYLGLTREGLMTKIKFLRDNISLSVGIPVFEALAHLNIGFYEDTVKKLPIHDQRRVIEAFIEGYCATTESHEIKENVFSELVRCGEWTEKASGFVSKSEEPGGNRQVSNEFILHLWHKPPLKL